jgi:hypothetical protein
VRLVRSAPGFVRRHAAEDSGAVEPGRPADWAAQVRELGTRLAAPGWRGSDVAVVVSDHWVRYAIVPAHDDLDEAEREAHARHVLAATFGVSMDDWTLAFSTPMDGRHVVAALPAGLVRDVRAAVGAASGRLVSVQPHLSAAFAVLGNALTTADGWFATVDDGVLAMAHASGGTWTGVHSVRTSADWSAEILRLRAFSHAVVDFGADGAVLVDVPARLRPSGAGPSPVRWTEPMVVETSTVGRLLAARAREFQA